MPAPSSPLLPSPPVFMSQPPASDAHAGDGGSGVCTLNGASAFRNSSSLFSSSAHCTALTSSSAVAGHTSRSKQCMVLGPSQFLADAPNSCFGLPSPALPAESAAHSGTAPASHIFHAPATARPPGLLTSRATASRSELPSRLHAAATAPSASPRLACSASPSKRAKHFSSAPDCPRLLAASTARPPGSSSSATPSSASALTAPQCDRRFAVLPASVALDAASPASSAAAAPAPVTHVQLGLSPS